MDVNFDETSEHSPLLSSFPEPRLDDILKEPPNSPARVGTNALQLRTITLIAICAISLGFADELIGPAQTRVLESIFCRSYYREHDPSMIGSDGGDGVAEHLCKIEEVQSNLAMLTGWQMFFDGMPSLLLAVPFGYLADTYGRKPLFCMGLTAFWMKAAWVQLVCFFWNTFPVRLTWLSAIAGLFGASNVVTAIGLTMIADVVPEDERATHFLRLSGLQLAAQYLAPPLSGLLMKKNPWIPMLLGLGIKLLPPAASVLLHETVGSRKSTSPVASSAASLPVSDSRGLWRSTVRRVYEAINFVRDNAHINYMLAMFLQSSLATTALSFLPQYISTRLAISLSDTAILLSVVRAVDVVTLVGILPAMSRVLQSRFLFSAAFTNLNLARASAILMTASFLILALSSKFASFVSGLLCLSLGCGLQMLFRSIITDFVEKHSVARLYTMVTVFETIGMIAGAPLMATLLGLGLRVGGTLTGLPFLLSAALIFGVAFSLCFLPKRKR